MSVLIKKPNEISLLAASTLMLVTLWVGWIPSATARHANTAAATNAQAIRNQKARGKMVYLEQCLACHQVDGAGVVGMNPPLIQTKWVLTTDKPTLIEIVLKGMTGEINVNGDSYSNNMPSYSNLSDQQIADVLTYVRNNFGNKAAPITAAEVTAVRRKTK